MVARLLARAARRRLPVYVLAIPLLSYIFQMSAISNTSLASVDGRLAGQRFWSVVFTLVIGPLVACTAFASREYAILPVSRREYGLVRWILGTVVFSMCTGVARTIALYNNPPDDRTIHAAVLTGVLSDFLLCGAGFGIGALTVGSQRAAWNRPSKSPLTKPWHVRAIMAGFCGAMGILAWLTLIMVWSFVSIAPMPQAPSVLGLPVQTFWVFLIAGLLTLIGLRHRPVPFNSMAQTANAPDIFERIVDTIINSIKHRVRRPAGIGRVGLRLLVAREIRRACGNSVGLLAAVWVLLALRYRTILPSDAFIRLFEVTIPQNGHFPLLVIFLPSALVPSIRNGLAASLRHLRTLPLPATRLNALFLAESLAYWVLFIALYDLLCLVTVGRLPHIEAAPVMLCIGITVLLQSAQLFSGSWLSTSFTVLLPLLVVFQLMTLALPSPFDALTHPASLGLLLLCMAAAANAWILRRSTSYHRPGTAFLLARRTV